MTDGPSRTDDNADDLASALSDVIAPLGYVDPATRSDDLDVISEVIGDATVIGMGEASHGTREFFEFKHRLFRYLAEERGVRLLGFEANFAAMLSVDDYVTQGDGTAEEALSQACIHGAYRNESVLALVEWIRDFNDGRPADDKIRVHGIDVQHASAAVSRLEAYFEAVDPDVLGEIRGPISTLATPGFPDFSDEETLREHLDARGAVVSTLGDALDEHETTYVEAASRRRYRVAERLVWTIEQGRKQFEAIHQGRTDNGANVRIRDSAMAAQAQWLRRHESADRIALWGHNAHLTRGAFGGGTVRHTQGIPSVGKNLAMLQHVDYYALGLALGGGTVTAAYVPEDEYRAYEIESPPAGSIPDVFRRVDAPLFFLDVADLPADHAVSEWLDTGPCQFDIEGGYRNSPVNLVETDLRTQFDGLVFVSETSAAQPLSRED